MLLLIEPLTTTRNNSTAQLHEKTDLKPPAKRLAIAWQYYDSRAPNGSDGLSC